MKEYKFCPLCAKRLDSGRISGNERKFCPGCGWVDYKNPIPAVACVVFNRKNEILLVKRANQPEKGKWSLPAGFIEQNESPEKAALRELYEETGVKGTIEKHLGVFSQASSMYGTVLAVGYLLRASDRDPVAGDDALDAGYFKIDPAMKIPFSSHRYFLKKAMDYAL